MYQYQYSYTKEELHRQGVMLIHSESDFKLYKLNVNFEFSKSWNRMTRRLLEKKRKEIFVWFDVAF